MIRQILNEARSKSDPVKAKTYSRFFKTGPGQYGEGDKFLGLMVPDCRKIVANFWQTDLQSVQQLLDNEFHEIRLIGLLILVKKYEKGDFEMKKTVYKTYLNHTSKINNWDLVDLSAHKIIGPYLEDKNRDILAKLAVSKSLWERRIAILSTYHFIRKNDFKDALKIAELLVNDDHDLIHKAVGWMLREIGKRDLQTEEIFLKRHYKTMPRTMLRYAIEKFEKPKKDFYMNRKSTKMEIT
jgi:3-methyladenine DNA glycosylase AlkD